MASFDDFCKFIVQRCVNSREYDPDGLLNVFVNFIEPFAQEHDITIPDDLITVMESLCDDSSSLEEGDLEDLGLDSDSETQSE